MIRQYKKHQRIYIVHHALKRVSPQRRYIKYNTVPALAVAALPADKAIRLFVLKWLVAALPMPGYSFSDGHSVFKVLFTDELSRLSGGQGKSELQKVIDLLETGETDTEVIQEKLGEVVCAINDLQEKFDENDSEIETAARDCIGETVGYVLEWFSIPIDVEEAIRKRDW